MKEKLLKKENMIVFVLLGILLLVIAIPLDSDKDKNQTNEAAPKKEDVMDSISADTEMFMDESMEYCLALETRIEEILSAMEGVGNVQAMVTVSSSREMIVEKDEPVNRATVTESDGNGGNRSTNESSFEYETIYQTDSEGNKIPYVLEALFHIDAHKIKVVKMK